MAAVLNFFLPGLGHLIIGRPLQGFLWFVMVVMGYLMFIFPGICLHLVCMMVGYHLQRRDEMRSMERAFRRAQGRE